MGDTDNSDFGSDGGGKNYKCHVIPNALRVPKMYILSMLENSRVITIPITQYVPIKKLIFHFVILSIVTKFKVHH